MFVHGLGSNPESTWRSIFDLCGSDPHFDGYTLDSYTYPTQLVRGPFGKRMASLDEIAAGLKTELHLRYKHSEDITLVGHSLGGLVIRQYVLNEIKSQRKPLCSRGILYATPNTGASLATIGKNLSINHRHLRQLSTKSDVLGILNSDWLRLDVESTTPFRFVAGGSDGIVTTESARAYIGARDYHMVISATHRNITQASSTDSVSYLLLKDFVPTPNLPLNVKDVSAGAPLTSNASSVERAANPLFEIYHREDEPYYVQRAVDRDFDGTHIWVSGESGTGKTAALRRHALQAGLRLKQITLSAYECNSALSLLRGICEELASICDIQGPPIGSTAAELINFFRRTSKDIEAQAPSFILIEEIPVGSTEEIDQLLSYILQLSLSFDWDDVQMPRFAVSSIVNPLSQAGASAKMQERVRFIQLDSWGDEDVRSLIVRIATALGLTIQPSDVTDLAIASAGSPRFIKLVFSRLGRVNGALSDVVRMTAAEGIR